ncbi:MAG: MBL fold metallo-hydrolase, partial [Muricauda sp.]|nr:MBL fold metallo-hydrolase [Allomuricauda sp.]
YMTDVKRVEEEEVKKMKGAKVLVVNALRVDPHHSHFSLDEAIDFAKEVGADKTYFTHISHLLGFHDEVEKSLPENIHLAYDNLQIKI